MESILCKKPVILFNPRALDVINYGCATINVMGVDVHDIYSKEHRFRKSAFHPRRQDVTSLNYQSFQVHSLFFPEWIPLYIVVPCGKCALCQARKREDWATRFHAESQTSSTLPVFFTLTYNEQSVPKNKYVKVTRQGHFTQYVNSLRKTDLQKFLKRLRVYLERKLNYHTKIRYAAVGEYGKKTQRPHYHVCMWNFPSPQHLGINNHLPWYVQDIQYILKSEAILHECWKESNQEKSFDFDYAGVTKKEINGKRVRNVGKKGDSKGCAKYVAKYVTKKCYVPRFAEKNRMLCSNRNGGIGVPYLRKNIETYRIPSNSQFFYIKEEKRIMPRLFKTWIYPSPSKLFGKRTYDMYKQFLTKYNLLVALEQYLGHNDTYFPSLEIIRDVMETDTRMYYYPYVEHNGITYHLSFFKDVQTDIYKRNLLIDILLYIRKEIFPLYIQLLDSFKKYTLEECHAILQIREQYKAFIKNLPERLFDTDTLNTTQLYYDNLTDENRII